MMRCEVLLARVLVGVCALGAAGCREAGTPPEAARPADTNRQVYQVKGVIRELHPDRKKVKVSHEEIPGYMEAMTMMLDVKDARELDGLQTNDQISFHMVVTENDGWIERITRLGVATGAITTSAPPTFRRAREVEPLNVGDVMPDYPFTNQVGRPVRLSDFKGQAVAITFIFTRCPFPTFCPRMTDHFQTVHNQLLTMPGGPTNWHLLTISFDPEFDTPAMLRNYASRYKYDPTRWSFLTGDLIEITAITEQFGLQFWREGGTINHNLRTVVIDAGGRVQWIRRENEWKPEELIAEMVKAAAPPPALPSAPPAPSTGG
ncbi:MAG TPA: SCO family protein [Methylomirabilota bacterium]|nr:SCO family protein [Methylomirabilota bacterium]